MKQIKQFRAQAWFLHLTGALLGLCSSFWCYARTLELIVFINFQISSLWDALLYFFFQNLPPTPTPWFLSLLLLPSNLWHIIFFTNKFSFRATVLLKIFFFLINASGSTKASKYNQILQKKMLGTITKNFWIKNSLIKNTWVKETYYLSCLF